MLLVILAVVLFIVCPVGGSSAEPEVHQGKPKAPNSDPAHTFTVCVTTYTERGLDKKVDVLVEIHVGEQVIATTTIGPFAAEEHKEGYSGRVIKVPLAQWPADVVPDLRLTMNVVDDP